MLVISIQKEGNKIINGDNDIWWAWNRFLDWVIQEDMKGDEVMKKYRVIC